MSEKRETKKITAWEAGQEIIKVADCLSEVQFELMDCATHAPRFGSMRARPPKIFADS